MAIDKENQMSTINDEEIKEVLKAFKLSYKKEGENTKRRILRLRM